MFFNKNPLLDSLQKELIPLEKEEQRLNKVLIKIYKEMLEVQQKIKKYEDRYKKFLDEKKSNTHKNLEYITKIDVKKLKLMDLEIQTKGICLFLEMTQEQLTPSKNSTYPRKSLWRLLIDGKNQIDENPMIFDNDRGDHHGEEGYLANSRKAYLYMERTLHQPLTAEMIITIHDIAARCKYHTLLGIKQTTTMVTISKGCVTEAGAKEILTNLGDIVTPMPFELKAENITAATLPTAWFHVGQGDAVLKKLNTYIDDVNKELKGENNDEKKLVAIAKFIQKAELLHPFRDYNMRTMLIICNKLLLENGFTPVIFENPNCVEGFSIKELCKEIKDGMARAKQYIETAPTPTHAQNKKL